MGMTMFSMALIAVLICLAGITADPRPNPKAEPKPEPKPNPKDIHIHIHGLGSAGLGGMAPMIEGADGLGDSAPVVDGESEDEGNRFEETGITLHINHMDHI